MADRDVDEEVLSDRYERVVATAEALEAGGGGTIEEADVEDAVASAEACWQMVLRAALFSDNEEIDDVATPHIAYLMAPYYVAQLKARIYRSGFEPDERDRARMRTLMEAQLSYATFLRQVDAVGLLSDEDREDWERFEEGEEVPREKKREVLIGRARRKAALEADLARLDGQDQHEEEVVREAAVVKIRLAVMTALAEMASSKGEIDMLKQMVSMRMRDDPALKAPPPQPQPLAPITISKRDLMRMEIFRNPNPPTMSLEEYYARQHGDMVEAQAAAASAPAPAEESDDSDNDIISDRNTLKAREWDDWKDDNPKGSGNTMSNVG